MIAEPANPAARATVKLSFWFKVLGLLRRF